MKDTTLLTSERLGVPDLSMPRSDDQIIEEAEAYLSLCDEIVGSQHSSSNLLARLATVNISSALLAGHFPSVERIIHGLPDHLQADGYKYSFEELAGVALEAYFEMVELNSNPRNIGCIADAKRNFQHIVDQLAQAGLVPGLDVMVASARLESASVYRKSTLDYTSAPDIRGRYSGSNHAISIFMEAPFIHRTHVSHELTHATIENSEPTHSLVDASRGIMEATVQHIADRSTVLCLEWSESHKRKGINPEDQELTIPWVPNKRSLRGFSKQSIFLDPRLYGWEADTSYRSERDLMYTLARLAGRGAGVIDFIGALVDGKGEKVESLDDSLTEALSGALPLGINQTVLSWIKDNTEGPRSDELTEGLPDDEKVDRVLRIVREATGTADLSRLASWREKKRVTKNLRADISELRTA